MIYTDLQEVMRERAEHGPVTPKERAERIFRRLKVSLMEDSKEEHDVTIFKLNDPTAPDHIDIHSEFMKLLGVEDFPVPGPEDKYQFVNIPVYADPRGNIVRQTLNLGEDPAYPGCENMIHVIYTAQRGASLHPCVKDVGGLALG